MNYDADLHAVGSIVDVQCKAGGKLWKQR